MPNDDLTVGRCEALSDAKIPLKRSNKLPRDRGPLDEINNSIAAWEENKSIVESRLDALYALRAKLSDPECAKAVQTALELLR